MGVHVDPSARSQLAWCSDCPSFRELRGTRAAALTAAAHHADQVHQDTDRAKAIRQAATRAGQPK